jgi:hypothetical protein
MATGWSSLAVVLAVVVGRQIKLYRSSINQQYRSRPHSGCRLLKVVSVVVLSAVISVSYCSMAVDGRRFVVGVVSSSSGEGHSNTD